LAESRCSIFNLITIKAAKKKWGKRGKRECQRDRHEAKRVSRGSKPQGQEKISHIRKLDNTKKVGSKCYKTHTGGKSNKDQKKTPKILKRNRFRKPYQPAGDE